MNEKRTAILHSRIGALAERCVYVGFAIQAKFRGRDSDDGVRFALIDKSVPDRFFASTEAALPQAVADDRDRCRVWLVVLRQKCATLD